MWFTRGMLVLALIPALALGASQTCDSKCASDLNRCMQGCGSSGRCGANCTAHHDDCASSCSQTRQKAESADHRPKEVPCADVVDNPGTRVGKEVRLRPCTAKEQKERNEAMNSKQTKDAFKCKDADGRPGPCPEDAKKAVEEMNKAMAGKVCTDPDGKPHQCEGVTWEGALPQPGKPNRRNSDDR
jgi:hypothetical protein